MGFIPHLGFIYPTQLRFVGYNHLSLDKSPYSIGGCWITYIILSQEISRVLIVVAYISIFHRWAERSVLNYCFSKYMPFSSVQLRFVGSIVSQPSKCLKFVTMFCYTQLNANT